MGRHFIDNHINFRRMFAEAIRDSIVDNFDRRLIRPGYFLIRLGRERPLIGARIYWRDHEPGLPDNKLDRWPLPVLAGEMLGEYCDPVLVWTGRDRQPLVAPEGYTVEAWYRYLCADAAWARSHAPSEPAARPSRPVDLAALPPILPRKK